MNKRLSLSAAFCGIALTVLGLSGCGTYFRIVGKESKTFTSKEISILERTTQAIRFDYGYDDSLDIDYVYSYPDAQKDIRNNEKKFFAALDDTDTETLISFYEKVYEVYQKTVIWEKLAESGRKWIRYTYISKYLLPGIDTYTGILERAVLSRDPGYSGKIGERKAAVRESVLRGLENQEYKRELEEAVWLQRMRK